VNQVQEAQPADQEAGKHPGAVAVGLAVFFVLAVFTGVEYAIAKEVEQSLVPLVIIAALKAGLILWYFMHLSRTWAGRHS
jgi:heme/copper-type cytochrome/quinol oxidase subunit 4